MAKAGEPRPRTLSAGFGAYFVLVLVLAYLLAPRATAYVDPGAIFWVLAAYVVLGGVALVGVGTGALGRARRLDERIDALLADRSRARASGRGRRRPPAKAPPAGEAVVDSGSPEQEIAALLDGLEAIGGEVEADLEALDGSTKAAEATAHDLASLAAAEEREVARLERARAAVAISLVGPALAAIAIVGAFAPLLPAADGMLLADFRLSAFLGLAGAGSLVGLAAYTSAAFWQIHRRSS